MRIEVLNPSKVQVVLPARLKVGHGAGQWDQANASAEATNYSGDKKFKTARALRKQSAITLSICDVDS